MMAPKLFNSLLFISGLFALPTPALAEPQPLAIPAQPLTIGPKSSKTLDAYCLLHDGDLPQENVAFTHVAAGTATVCVDGACKPLQDAIGKEIVVHGVGGFGVTFENKLDREIKISFDTTTALSTKAESIALPSVALPVHFDEARQLTAWQALGQVGRITQIAIARDGAAFTVVGADDDDRTLFALDGVTLDNIGKTIARFATGSQSLSIDAPFGPRRMRTLLASVRMEASRLGLSGRFRPSVELQQNADTAANEITDVATEISPDHKDVTTNMNVHTANATVRTQIVISFEQAQPLGVLGKVRNVAHDVAAKAKPTGTVLRTGTDVRSAVRHEIRALTELNGVDQPTIWLILRGSTGYLMVRISPSEVVSWG